MKRATALAQTICFSIITISVLNSYGQEQANYKSCDLLIYKQKQDQACGLENAITKADPVCGVEEYQACIPWDDDRVVKSDGNEISSEQFPELGNRKVDGDHEDAEKICDGIAKTPKFTKLATDRYEKKLKSQIQKDEVAGKFEVKGSAYSWAQDGRPTEFSCFVRGEIVFNTPYMRGPNCPVEKYKTCNVPTYKTCRDQKFGIELQNSGPHPACGHRAVTIDSSKDQEYFSKVISTLKELSASQADPIKWYRARMLLNERNLKGRNTPLQVLADLKGFIGGLNIKSAPNASQRSYNLSLAFVAMDFYIRANASYNSQRIKDIFALDGIASDIKKQKSAVTKSLSDLQSKIQSLGLTPKMAQAVLASIQAVNSQDGSAVLALVRDLKKMVKSNINTSNSETESWLQTLASYDPVFNLLLAEVYIAKGNYQSAQLKIMDAQTELSQPERNDFLPTGGWLFGYLQENAIERATNELESAGRFWDTVNATNSVPLTLTDKAGKELPVPASVVAILEQSKSTVGDSLASSKLQLLSTIEQNVINPLTELIEKTKL